MVDSLEMTVEPSDSQSSNTIDFHHFVNYLQKSICVLHPEEEEVPSAFLQVLDDKIYQDCIRKFINDPQVWALCIQRISSKEYDSGETDDEKETDIYYLSNEISCTNPKMSSIVFTKRGIVIESDKSIHSQLRVVYFSDGSPYETLHAISKTMAPYFKSYVKEKAKIDRDGDKMAPTVEKKIAELEMGLLHLQQNIDIPEISLPIHPTVIQIIKQCAEEGRKPKVADFGCKVEDSTFLNQLQNGVNRWIKEIQKVTKLNRDPESGTALQEISFWLNLERALHRIQERRESVEISLTLDILKHGKRFHATVSFDTDTGLKQALATVNDYNPLMKDFPINDLLSATELDRIRSAIQQIFIHLRKIRNTKYPIQRVLRLVEAISRDLCSQLLKVLGTRRLMHIPFNDFEKVMSQCFELFNTWDDEYDKLTQLLREVVKRKRDEHMKMVWRVSPAHKKLQSRMEHMRRFRRQHEQLRTVIVRVLRPVRQNSNSTLDNKDNDIKVDFAFDAADANAISEVNLAYENVKEVDCLDISKEGSESWEAAVNRYEERIERVEARITAHLRDQLGTAKNANEMFRIFSRFNALFVRPHIRGAIREYQTQLIQRVKDDIETLHEKFKVQYAQSTCCKMSSVRDLPPIAGSIIWVKQIDFQLTMYLKRVEDVLGKGWENHIEGQKLKADGDSFRTKLSTQEIFDEWARKVQQRNIGVTGRIFTIENMRSRTGRGGILKLKVNFLPEIITLSKEVRNLKNLGFRVPIAIVNKAHQANLLYPFAISLIESIRTYERTLEKIEDKSNIVPLIAGLRRDVLGLISEGITLIWESYKLDSYVQRLSEVVLSFQEKVEDLLVVEEQLEADIRSLETCPYSANTFAEILTKIQKSVDELSLKNFSNLHIWVSRLDEEVERNLAFRLEAGVKAWTDALLGKKRDIDLSMDTDAPIQPTHKLGGDPKILNQLHEVRITNQTMYLYPSIEDARFQIMQQLFAWQAIVTSQIRLQSSRYQVGLDKQGSSTYRNLLTKLPSGKASLELAYESIESKMKEIVHYVEQWLRYQSLWDLQPDNLYGKLNDDITAWMKCLNDIKKTRTTFDTSDTRKEFGPVIIDFAKVQSKVSLKYDSWHKETLGKFGTLLGNEMTSFHAQVSRSRSDLEQHSIDTATTSDAVSFITYVQSLKRKMKIWEKQVEIYKEGQRILERQRFQFPVQWLHVDNIEGEWGAFNEIIKRKDTSIQTQVASLQFKIVTEDKAIETRTTDFFNDWEQSKPVEGHLRPDDALQQLQIFENKFARLKEERDNVAKAKEALELLEPGTASLNEDRMQVVFEELQDLKGVWSELSKIWAEIDETREKPWLSIQPRKLRLQLDTMLSQLKELPARLRQYSSYEYVKKTLQNYTKVNMLIVELKSDALKERHWKLLMKQLKVNWLLSELTLGQLWDVNLQKNEGTVKDIILVAQGEMALEEFLKQVRESWQNYELELINYQNKCRLIRGWDDLFNKVKEHINSVAAMKLSPYYKVFEEEALTWEEKLNRINSLFDIWIDVQRRWVYLEGIFSGSADIKTLLPVETSRFQSISTEFLGLMKKVSKSPMVMDILNIPGVQRSLERLADLLGKIQKALGEYLERERTSFPRFYFVGDEDLLEIIGNSKNIARLQKHFKKMFAGVASILLNEDNTTITGVASREGEEVIFKNPVSTTDHPKINEWLTFVEREMRLTLASNLAHAVQDIKTLKNDNINSQALMCWCDRYQAQIIILAVQILWSEDIESALQESQDNSIRDPLDRVLLQVESTLNILADSVLQEQPPLRRKKLEHMINEFVHKRTVTRRLIYNNITNPKAFEWLSEMRFYFDPKKEDVLQQLTIHMANSKFFYGFEYLGVQDRLVQTPLTDRCYLTMTQALESRLGGSPFGPAGTGKTESVKALGHQLGRFVLVFNCDETFDFQAMGRIFVGLCQVGAWGCFDEFNRLEERMLSAVSQQIQTIQEALKSHIEGRRDDALCVELVGKQVKVSSDIAIFITMNPGYAGRSNLPDNLKKLFRSLAMTTPDRQLIAEVMLFSQGFRSAEKLACKIVPFFRLCDEQLSNQSHYDFGLRALKSVLISAGNVKRDRIQKIKEGMHHRGDSNIDEASIAENLPEQEILIQSVCETMVPKLVAEDIPLLFSLLNDVFPSVNYVRAEMEALKNEIKRVCAEEYLVCGEGDDQGGAWQEKVLQLYQISNLNHGLMMVGPSGSGKTSAWKVLLKALERHEGLEGVAHVIDPKAISKETLYGVLDPNTREWTDGLFTHILRKIIDNVRGEINKRQWIIFDGDVDPEWVENLNSVLDDNKLLTLPNGERLSLPPNVRIMFEVQDLKYATLATVSRCGMVWFSEDVLSTEMIFENYMLRLKYIPLDDGEEDLSVKKNSDKDDSFSPTLHLQRDAANFLQSFFSPNGLIVKCLEYASKQEHIMDFTRLRALNSLFSMLNQALRNTLQYNHCHSDFPLSNEQLERYITKSLVYAILWSFTGDAKLKIRADFGDFIRSITMIPLPSQTNIPIVDFKVDIQGEWQPWSNKVPQIEIETHKVASPDVVVPTLDTVRHESLLYTWLAEHKPLVLCGPPGSGKTMTLFSALRALPDMEVVGLNFSSATTPELLLKTFDHYCEYRRTPNGVVLSPAQLGKWLVLFCDEINLPEMDKYGTQRVISFLRQLVEHKGFFRTSDQAWVSIERIQFVGACNPPTDPGRKPLSYRFLRHVPVIYVDYPGEVSLKQIYGTFTRAMLRLIPSLKGYAEPLTNSMVEFYLTSQERFTQDMQPHYVYSPREMTRWVRGICEAIRPLDNLSIEGLIRLWAHEALRLFQDRLVEDTERVWTNKTIDIVALKHFPGINKEIALNRPILYSNWLSKDYIPVSRRELRGYVKARLKVFYEEELDVPLVLFDEVLEHVLRIDRIFRQPQGHLLLIGVSGAGKTTLSRFVAWMNGLSVFQIKELQAKNEAANAKLRQMVKDQQEAEKKKVQSQEIQHQLAIQTVTINQKRDNVMADLAQVEPAVIDAQNAVKSIKKQHLVEVRSMANPPAIVKVALESICLLLGENASDWKSIRAVIMRDNFINTIVSNFSTENISDEVREKMRSRYLCNPEYNFEKVNRASMACGPMVKWAIAQIEYADMLKRVEPLRDELHSLEQQANTNKHKGEEVKDLISQLELSIASYKEEYAQLISQAQAIKTDLENVQGKVDRSIALLKSLVIERERWEATSETFRSQMSTIVGDVLLSSAFLAYAGYFDQHYRQNLFSTWCQHLHSANLQFRPDIARTEYLSNPDERLRWQANALPADELCTENAIMLKRFNRYPLIIDPSGQATEFLLNEYKARKITKTSFLDDSFRKNLESALRFGNPLLVQDVENYDPILNPVLNRELRRTGGRVLITLGDQDIDLSPSFVIFLSTRDPTVEFLPDICSRVTFVNFTVTRSSLQSQCLNQVLKTERPDIDEKRSDLLKLQGEFHLRLRQLEKSLLQALNDAKGKILDDDSVITTLETLKQEAADISKKVEETDKVIAEIETVSQQYLPLSQACSNIYFTMDSLNQIHFLYQYSLKMFLDIFTSVLNKNSKLTGITDYVQRLSHITNELFSVSYERVARGMLHNDRLTFALLLCRIHLKGAGSGTTYDDEFTFFLRGKEGVLNIRYPPVHNLSSDQQEAAVRLSSKLQSFRKLNDIIQNNTEFSNWLQSQTPETCVPKLWEEEKPTCTIKIAMNQLLAVQAFRPDRVIAAASLVVTSVLGGSFMNSAEIELDFSYVVENELKSSVPALLCSVPGFDASSRIDDLAADLGKSIVSIAIGSTEGFTQADRAINIAVKAGRWVLLKNVHLAPQWLVQLEKKLHSIQPHNNFRLFLTMEINSKVPVNLLRAGRIFVFEPPPGIRANLLRTFSTVPASRMMKEPNERARLYFLLAWFHAIVQERLRYVPLGWAKHYEFNESDLRVACDTLDTWIESTAMGRTNLPPEKVPWDALITLLSECIYGGKIDNEFDQRLLTSFLRKLFTPRSFESDFALVANIDGTQGTQRHITMPDGTRRDHFLKWIESLSDKQTPSWLGLPNNAEKVLLTTRGTDLISKLLKMQQLEDEDELAYCNDESLDSHREADSDGRPTWMKTLHNSATTWLQLLPKSLVILKRTIENIKDPLYRYFEREVNSGSKLLKNVIHDLQDVVLICKGEKKQTNYHRTMLSELIKGIIPAGWRRYTVPRGCTVIQWITDFSHRVSQLQEVSRVVSQSGANEIKNFPVWLGGLFNPEAYITATRQCVAQANNWSLEELQLDVFVCNSDNTVADDYCFAVTGLKLQGAQCKNNMLYLTSTIMTDLHVTILKWVKRSTTDTVEYKLALPVYLNSTRTELLFNVDLQIAPSQDSHSFYERGVAILISTALN
ncbi:dynein heavy chain, cytoplasmic isoform X2 [Phymastichus coffea]|uniref:dynein heavy chain, cytoplasmic isoform X2 n=1 Tax=Phymastichus coffea TaxID=108790 RepID=UPI00273CED73|nr:dynein heavy chain, cytoplasmic isoform X2 [Phymastichus coffea]